MPAMTMTEKILARAAGKSHVEPGENGVSLRPPAKSIMPARPGGLRLDSAMVPQPPAEWPTTRPRSGATNGWVRM